MDWRELSETFARWLETNAKVRGQRRGNRIDGHCPRSSHEDKSASFSYYIEGAGWKCSCDKGKASELIKELGLDFGINPQDLKPIVIKEYDYKDESGKVLYQVQRFMPKNFIPRVPDAAGGWKTGKGCMDGVRRVIYKLEEISALPDGAMVLIVDGEKDVETAWNHYGIPATCCSGGMAVWSEFSGIPLQKKKVIIIADKDPDGKGRRDALKVKEHLKTIGVSAKIVEMPGPMPPIKDLTDWRMSGGSKDDLQKILSSRVDWIEIARSPIIPMAELTHLIDSEIEYAIKPICPKGTLTLLQGRPKGGKSTFALYTGLCSALGIWPSGIFEVPKPLNVLLVEYEDAPILVLKRVSRYMEGLGEDAHRLPPNLSLCDYPELWLDAEKYRDLLAEEISDRKLDLVIIDTLSHIHNADDENASADMKPVMANLKRIAKATSVCVLLIHHTKKSSAESAVSERARGSSLISASADVILDWGDRKKTNTTPVEFISKYDNSFDFQVDYKSKPTGAVSWQLRESDEADPDQKKREMLNVLTELCKVSPEGISIITLARAMTLWSERTVYAYAKYLEDDGLVSISTGKASTKTIRLIQMQQSTK